MLTERAIHRLVPFPWWREQQQSRRPPRYLLHGRGTFPTLVIVQGGQLCVRNLRGIRRFLGGRDHDAQYDHKAEKRTSHPAFDILSNRTGVSGRGIIPEKFPPPVADDTKLVVRRADRHGPLPDRRCATLTIRTPQRSNTAIQTVGHTGTSGDPHGGSRDDPHSRSAAAIIRLTCTY